MHTHMETESSHGIHLQIYGLLHINNHAIKKHGMYKYIIVISVFMVASSPGLVHTVCACAKYSVTFSVKSFVHFLVHMRKIILNKNTELSLN